MKKAQAENKAQAEKAEKAKAQAEKEKAEELAKAKAFLYKQKQKRKAEAVKKNADAYEVVKYLCYDEKTVLANKTLTVKNRTIKSIRALDENADIYNTYSYNKNASDYIEAVRTLKALGFYIYTDIIKE